MDREAWRAAVQGVAKSWTDWVTELNWRSIEIPLVCGMMEILPTGCTVKLVSLNLQRCFQVFFFWSFLSENFCS